MSDLNIKKSNGTTQEELWALLAEGYEIEKELRDKLNKIRINIDKNKSPEVITAIRAVFGDSYISRSGNSTITYEMYCVALNLMRKLGSSKASEII